MFADRVGTARLFGRRRARVALQNRHPRSRRLLVERLEERRLLAGGGQNILLVVNPNDENALRIANAYQQLRDVPDSNIVFIAPPVSNGSVQFAINKATLNDTFLTPLYNTIVARGLVDQIDYIGTLGEPTRFAMSGDQRSFTYALSLLDVIHGGLDSDTPDSSSALYQTPTNIAINTNTAIHHSQVYNVSYTGGARNTQYYMAGEVANTWIRGNTPDQVIANLARTVAADGTHPTGTVYFEDNTDIRSTTRRGEWGRQIQTAAGNGTASYGGDGFSATSAQINLARGLARDTAGNLYIADTANNRVRKVTPAGIITTVAGNGTPDYGGDNGLATAASLNGPVGVAVDAAGNLYIADTANNRVRMVDYSTGVIITLAGTGTAGYDGDNGAATAAALNGPRGVAVDTSGNLYIADTANNRVRLVTAGMIITVAGNGTPGYDGDNGAATAAALNAPAGVAVDGANNLYIADTANNRIRTVSAGMISTVAGNGTAGFGGDNGLPTAAMLKSPAGIVFDAAGNLYIADTANNRIRMVRVATGTITTVAGNGTAGYNLSGYGSDYAPATSALLNSPTSIAVDDTTGILYLADSSNSRIRKVLNESRTQEQLTARGIPWLYEWNTSGQVPLNRNDVLGAVIGYAGQAAPNGSTYLAGSFVDNLTSCGAMLDDRSQSKDTRFIATGAAATTGSIIEPYAISGRFTNSSVYTFIADGSTMGEAVAKAVQTQVIQLFNGDLLSQPQADIPLVSITAGPAEGATVSGTVSLSATAALVSAKIATAVNRLELLVDGRLTSTISGASGTFNLNTATLTDGRHELRVVGVNNAAAESEGYKPVNVTVNNHNRSASTAVGNLTLTSSQVGLVSVSATSGDGTLSRIELRYLGRTLGAPWYGTSGSIEVNAATLAYDDNRVTPVAVFADGTETAGTPLVVTRQRPVIAGQASGSVQAAGLRAEYFLGKGGTSIANSDFSGTPDIVTTQARANLYSGLTYVDVNMVTQKYSNVSDRTVDAMATTAIDRLALRLSGKFNVATAGEYQFYTWRTNDSIEIRIDGQKVVGFDGMNGGLSTTQVPGLFLGPGEHDLVVLAANTVTSSQAQYFDISIEYRGSDGVTRVVDNANNNIFYQTNDAPVLAATGTQTLAAINEDPVGNPGTLVANIVGTTVSDVNPGAMRGIAVTAVVNSGGTWQYKIGASAWTDFVAPSDTAARLLPSNASTSIRFVPDANWYGSVDAGITYRAWDLTNGTVGATASTTVNGGVTPFSAATDLASITVRSLNDAPTGADDVRGLMEDGTFVFGSSGFGFSDTYDSPLNAFSGVKITTVPTAGSLRLNGDVVVAGQIIDAADIDANRLTFVPAANGNGSPYASFTFQVWDDGGTDYGGVDLAVTPNTITFNLIPVPDPPTGTDKTKSTWEGAACFLVVADFGFNDSADRPANNLTRVLITTLPTAGTLKLNNVLVTAGQSIAVTDIGPTSLKFSPAPNGSGTPYASFTFQVQDDGGTDYGGADLDPTPNTMAINATPVNDEPAGSDATIGAQEDVAYPFSASDFGFSDPFDSPPNALSRVKVATLPALGSLQLNGVAVAAGQYVDVADINLGRFTFTSASNASGTAYTSFTFQVQDDGGTANSGVDLDATPNTLLINVAAVNDPPVVGAVADSPDPVSAGLPVTLTATGVGDTADVGGLVVRVDFYRESNGTAGLQTGSGGDTLVGSDLSAADGWSASVSTTGLAPGSYTYYAQATDNQGAPSVAGTAAAATTNTVHPLYNLDADGNGTADALTDGILILRYLFDSGGQWNYSDALGAGATRTTRTAIKTFLDGGRTTVLDADGNGTPDALTDGILILRYLFDPAGQWNYSDALGSGATRTTRSAIRTQLDLYNPHLAPAAAAPVAALAVEPPAQASAPVEVTGDRLQGTGEKEARQIGSPLPLAGEGSGVRAAQETATVPVVASDALIAGVASTVLRGGVGEEVSVGGTTTSCKGSIEPANARVQDTVLQQWKPPCADDLPIARLAAASNSGTLTEDSDALDRLYGDGGLDWFLVKPSRRV